MNKLSGESMNIVEDNIEKLKEIFPEIFVENKIDFEVLQQLLGENIENDSERYSFTWNGKTKARQIAQEVSKGTLRPVKEDSKNWDDTENIYIEGDNLEVLKLLQKSYYNKIKMIYIDPPYNTGKDFVYKDNFKDNLKNYLEITGQLGEDGQKLSTNSDTSGRYHSDWLSMMYPRLKLARNLLTDDGVIFISIDDNEVTNLKKICDEIFGEENFVNCICIKMSDLSGPKMAHIKMKFPKIKEYLIIYKKKDILFNEIREKKIKWDSEYKTVFKELTPDDYKKIKSNSLTENDIIEINNKLKDDNIVPLSKLLKEKEIIKEEEILNFCIENAYRIVRTSNSKSIKNKLDSMQFDQKATIIIINDSYEIVKTDYDKNSSDPRVQYVFAADTINSPIGDIWYDINTSGLHTEGNVRYTNAKKPLKLIERIISSVVKNEDIVVDFFAGSSTTAHAVMNFCINNYKKVKYILIQLQEDLDVNFETSKDKSKEDIRKAIDFLDSINKPHKLTEIGKERIRRAGEKIKSDETLPLENREKLDIGFKVFKLDSSNIKEWDSGAENLEEKLFDSIYNIKQDRSPLDILYEILLKYGFDLNSQIEEKNGYYSINNGSLLIVLNEKIELESIYQMCEEYKQKIKSDEKFEVKVVLRDNSFENDTDKANAIKILEQSGIKEIRSI